MNLFRPLRNLHAEYDKGDDVATRSPASLREQLERRLVADIVRCDTRALQKLYTGYRPRISRFLARMGCPEEDHDEICNEVFYTVWRKAGSYDHSAKVSTWIFGIARNKGLKLRERRWHAQQRNADVPLHELPELVLGDAARLELRQWLDVALAILPDDQRMVVELTFIEGLAYQEIAEIMQCPVNTVKTRMFNARRKLVQFLSPERNATARIKP